MNDDTIGRCPQASDSNTFTLVPPSDSIVANYSGDCSNAPSKSTTLAQVVTVANSTATVWVTSGGRRLCALRRTPVEELVRLPQPRSAVAVDVI